MDNEDDEELRAKRCETCRFFADYDAEVSGLGDCHRFPPRMTFAPRNGPIPNDPGDQETILPQNGGWPFVYALDWCGEWQPKQEDG